MITNLASESADFFLFRTHLLSIKNTTFLKVVPPVTRQLEGRWVVSRANIYITEVLGIFENSDRLTGRREKEGT